MPANLVFRLKNWGARDNGIPPRSTPGVDLASPSIKRNLNICQGTMMLLDYFKISQMLFMQY